MRDDPSWDEWEKTLASFYNKLNYDRRGAGFLMGAGHQALEDLIDPSERFSVVLEVGVGAGEHLHYVRHGFDVYHMLDRSQAMLDLVQDRYRNDRRTLDYRLGNVEKLPFAGASVDRLVATHVLEHVYRPHEVLREWNRVLKPGGAMSILIPTDPGVAWRIGRAIGTRRAVTRMGLPYDYFMALEHVNPVNNLVALLDYYFPDARRRWWPFRLTSMDLNFFYVFHAVKR
jgi:phosphatidylethanolamine/phosphatidyl-N-methylethanolamine N-methyltransferase